MIFSRINCLALTLWASIAMTAAGFAAEKVKPGKITGVDVGRVYSMNQSGKLLLVDCRPSFYYRRGHIKGAINLPLKKYDKLISDRQKHLNGAVAAKRIIVLYCQNVKCPDAYAVAKKLITLGYSVSIYKGGWEEWKQAGLQQ